MSESDAVLFANEAFYRALADRDPDAMDTLWAHEGPVACIHPGWPALIGRSSVMASWRRLFAAGGALPSVGQADVFVFGDTAAVICYEEIDGQYLVATNLFRREGRQWKLVHHHAGPTAAAPAADNDNPPPRVN
jgi:ketosteroid isomerase-like protein